MSDRRYDLPPTMIRDQAAGWVIRMNSGEWTDADQHGLDTWLAQDVRHQAEFKRVCLAWKRLGGFSAADIPQMYAARRFGARTRVLSLAASVAALCIAGALLVLWMGQRGDAQVFYSTVKGEQLSITLADGSIVLLNTDTSLDVDYDARLRSIRLEKGEALFEVAPGDERPFQVIAGDGEIRDLGTRFSVQLKADEVAVVVLEGSVTVKTSQSLFRRPVGAGERIGYGAAGRITPAARVDAIAMTAWTSGRLIFDNVTLPEMASQVERYHDVRIVLEDPSSSTLRISGTFRTDDLDGLMRTLETILPLKADRSVPGVIRLYPQS